MKNQKLDRRVMEDVTTFTVDQLSKTIQNHLHLLSFSNCTVSGIVSEIRQWKEHYFFELQGDEYNISCVAWNPPFKIEIGHINAIIKISSIINESYLCRLNFKLMWIN